MLFLEYPGLRLGSGLSALDPYAYPWPYPYPPFFPYAGSYVAGYFSLNQPPPDGLTGRMVRDRSAVTASLGAAGR